MRQVLRSAFFGCSLALFVAAPAAAAVQVSFPPPGSVINVGSVVAGDVSPDIAVASVQFQYSRDQVNWTPIPDLGQPVPTIQYSTLWNAGDLAPGGYYLRVKVTEIDSTITYSAPIQVALNAPPDAAPFVSPAGALFRLRFDARNSSDPDGSIVDYAWDFGDGSVASGPLVEHQYSGPGSYTVGLTVTDNHGGYSNQRLIVAFAANGFMKQKAAANCGCKDMDVVSTGNVVGPDRVKISGDNSGVPDTEGRKLGPWNDGAPNDKLDFTKPMLAVANRFEVVANLVDNSTPKLCREGQRAQQTYRVSTRPDVQFKRRGKKSSDPTLDTSFDNNAETINCGFGDDLWCDDKYHGGGNAQGAGRDEGPPNQNKKAYDTKRIVWLDAPGIHKAPPNVLQDKAHTLNTRLQAKVAGNLGTCMCSWDVLIEIDNTGKVTRNELTNKKCG